MNLNSFRILYKLVYFFFACSFCFLSVQLFLFILTQPHWPRSKLMLILNHKITNFDTMYLSIFELRWIQATELYSSKKIEDSKKIIKQNILIITIFQNQSIYDFIHYIYNHYIILPWGSLMFRQRSAIFAFVHGSKCKINDLFLLL